MKKFTVFAALLSLLTLAVFSGCNSSSDSGVIIPPASDTKVGLYKITKIKSTAGVDYPFDTSIPDQVLYFDGEMAVANNTLKIKGRYQIAGYAEFENRQAKADTPAGKYITYNEFSADNLTVANFQSVAGSTDNFTLQVTDNAGIALDLTVRQVNNSSVAAINYIPWSKAPSAGKPEGGNPVWTNRGFYYDVNNAATLSPTNLIGNYMIKKIVVQKNGETSVHEFENFVAENDMAGELSVTAALGGSDTVQLNIALKFQLSKLSTSTSGFRNYFFKDDIKDTIPLNFPLEELLDRLPGIFTSEGMVMVDGSNTDIIYSPKKRNADGTTFDDILIDGAKVTFTLSKIIDGGLNLSKPTKVLTNTPYWTEAQ